MVLYCSYYYCEIPEEWWCNSLKFRGVQVKNPEYKLPEKAAAYLWRELFLQLRSAPAFPQRQLPVQTVCKLCTLILIKPFLGVRMSRGRLQSTGQSLLVRMAEQHCPWFPLALDKLWPQQREIACADSHANHPSPLAPRNQSLQLPLDSQEFSTPADS